MSFKQLINELKNEQAKKLYLIYGFETYLLDRALENFKKYIITDFPELNYTMLEGEHLKPDSLSMSCETFPFACDRRLVVVKNLYALKSGGKSDEDEAEKKQNETNQNQDLKSFTEVVSNLSDTTCLVLINYGSVDKRKKLFNDIKKYGSIYEFDRVERDDLSVWIKNVFSKSNKRIGPKALDHFIGLSGYLDKNGSKTLYDLENEITKLIHFMGEELEVSMAHIDVMLPKNIEHDIFKLINACAERRISDSLSIYSDQLLEGESSLGVLAMVSRQIRNMIGVSELRRQGYDARSISEKLKIHEYTVKLCIKYCERIDIKKLQAAFNRCLETESGIKSGKITERLGLEMLLVNLFE